MPLLALSNDGSFPSCRRQLRCVSSPDVDVGSKPGGIPSPLLQTLRSRVCLFAVGP